MDCRTARPLLLEAEPEELAGLAGTPLASHIRGCASCRARAEAILDGQRAVAAVLGQYAFAEPPPASPRSGAPQGGPAHARPLAAGRRQVRPVFRGAVVAAAVVLVAVLLVRLPDRMPAVPPSLDLPSPPVRVMAGGPVAVFETEHPSVTLVWTY